MGLIRSWLAPYAAVLFARDPWVGAALLFATALDPAIGVSGLLAVAISFGIARALSLSGASATDGDLSYNALLTGLAVGAWVPIGPTWGALLLIGAVAATVGAAAMRDLGTRSGLPVLTVPYIGAAWLVAAALPVLDGSTLPRAPIGSPTSLLGASLGALVFVPQTAAGLLVAMALVRWSRVGAALFALGAGLGWAIAAAAGLPTPLAWALMLNLGLTSAALGGVWTVPSPASFALAAVGAGLTALVTLGGAPIADALGLPLLIAPFNVVTLGALLALRQRVADRSPKSVDFLPGTPERNLRYYRTRVARFGARYAVRLRAPVRGTWEVSQAEGDGPTHLGAWRSALDLEVRTEDGRWCRGDGRRPEDYACWHLPVVACADGTVARVVDGVRDNPVGEVDLDDNWGNAVVLWHAAGLYSVVAHLSPGRIAVQEGQRVRRGETLGLCGSSGRSPRPHVHFQLQSGSLLGAPTLPVELHDVVRVDGPSTLMAAWTPKTGDRLRNLTPDEPARGASGWIPSRPFGLRLEGEREAPPVDVVPEIDLYGRRVLTCGEGRLFYAVEEDVVTVLDTLAPERSVLHLLHIALPRLPRELGPTAPRWVDHLPVPRPPAWLAPWLDLLAPFRAGVGIEMAYRIVSDGPDLVVEGRSTASPPGTPGLTTRARFRSATGLVSVERTLHGATLRAVRTEPRRTP